MMKKRLCAAMLALTFVVALAANVYGDKGSPIQPEYKIPLSTVPCPIEAAADTAPEVAPEA